MKPAEIIIRVDPSGVCSASVGEPGQGFVGSIAGTLPSALDHVNNRLFAAGWRFRLRREPIGFPSDAGPGPEEPVSPIAAILPHIIAIDAEADAMLGEPEAARRVLAAIFDEYAAILGDLSSKLITGPTPS